MTRRFGSGPSGSDPIDRGLAWCRWAGWLLVASGAVYAAILGVQGGEWSGPLSLRKPLLFGLSTGVTALSLAWVGRGLAPLPGDGLLFRGLAVALVLEVGLIDLQQARGVPSHFNRESWLVSGAMTGLILAATFAILYITGRALLRLDFRSDYRRAARAGLALLVLGCGLGVLATVVGESRVDAGLPPERIGEAGVLKFPHGVPLHALQILPLLVWGLEQLGVGLRARRRAVGCVAVSVLLATLYALAQTFSGRGRFDPSLGGWVLFVAAGLLAASGALAIALEGRTSGPEPAGSESGRSGRAAGRAPRR